MQTSVDSVFASKLSARGRLLALELIWLCGPELPLRQIASTSALADRTGLTVCAVQRLLPALAAAGVMDAFPAVVGVRPPQVGTDWFIPRELREFIFYRAGGRCTECRTRSDLTVDHAWPRALGGDEELDNLRTLCRPCNSRKGARV